MQQNISGSAKNIPEKFEQQTENVENICAKLTLKEVKNQTMSDSNTLGMTVIMESSATDSANESISVNSRENSDKETVSECGDTFYHSEGLSVTMKSSDNDSKVEPALMGTHANNEEEILTNNTITSEFGISENLLEISSISKNDASDQVNFLSIINLCTLKNFLLL